MIQNKFIFIVGAPRSGTTWLKSMLDQHDIFVSHPHELTIFSNYINVLDSTWDYELQPIKSNQWVNGLPSIWTEEDKDDFVRNFIEKVYSKLEAKDNQIILDKHPGYALCLDRIHKYIDNYMIIHIIRDGRNMALSMVDVNRRVGFGWDNYADAAEQWCKHVDAARKFGSQHPDRYVELRYEEMLADPRKNILGLFESIGIKCSEDQISRLVELNSFERKKLSGHNSKISAENRSAQTMWKTIPRKYRYAIARKATPLLIELSYTKDKNWWEPSAVRRIVFNLRRRLGLIYIKLRKILKLTFSKQP